MEKLEPNKQLSICIPTYNRAQVLRSLLIDLIPKVEPYQISIYISDNNSSDETEQIVKEFQKKYNKIEYHKNIKNIGADRNFEQVLKMSKSKYSWLLGDDDRIIENSLINILEILNKNSYQLVVTNGCSEDGLRLKNINQKSLKYSEHNILLSELWYTMTWISTLIYSKEIIEESNFEKYYDTNFIQSAVIFDYLAKKTSFSVYWIGTPSVIYPDEDKIVNHYTDKMLFLFIKCWTDVVLMLPDKYNIESKKRAIRSGGFNFRTLSYFALNGKFNFSEFLKYKNYFKYMSKVPIFLFLFLSISPKIFLVLVNKLKIFFRKKK